jgi:hypothetical protein
MSMRSTGSAGPNKEAARRGEALQIRDAAPTVFQTYSGSRLLTLSAQCAMPRKVTPASYARSSCESPLACRSRPSDNCRGNLSPKKVRPRSALGQSAARTVGLSLAVHPDDRTFSVPVGMSRTSQSETSSENMQPCASRLGLIGRTSIGNETSCENTNGASLRRKQAFVRNLSHDLCKTCRCTHNGAKSIGHAKPTIAF